MDIINYQILYNGFKHVNNYLYFNYFKREQEYPLKVYFPKMEDIRIYDEAKLFVSKITNIIHTLEVNPPKGAKYLVIKN